MHRFICMDIQCITMKQTSMICKKCGDEIGGGVRHMKFHLNYCVGEGAQ